METSLSPRSASGFSRAHPIGCFLCIYVWCSLGKQFHLCHQGMGPFFCGVQSRCWRGRSAEDTRNLVAAPWVVLGPLPPALPGILVEIPVLRPTPHCWIQNSGWGQEICCQEPSRGSCCTGLVQHWPSGVSVDFTASGKGLIPLWGPQWGIWDPRQRRKLHESWMEREEGGMPLVLKVSKVQKT
jgi:hypothetical protein